MDQQQFIFVYPPAPRVTDPLRVVQQMHSEQTLLGLSEPVSHSLSKPVVSASERLESSSIIRQAANVNKVNAFVISYVNSSDISCNEDSSSTSAVTSTSVEGSPNYIVLTTSSEQQRISSSINTLNPDSSFIEHSSNRDILTNGTQNFAKYSSLDSTDWDEFFGDVPSSSVLECDEDDIIVIEQEKSLAEESNVHISSDFTFRDTSPIVASSCSSVFDDVENSFTPAVERNLLAQLSATPPKEIKLPDEPLSCYEPLLQVPKESAADYVVSNTDYTILEVMRPIHLLSPSSHSSISVSEATPSAHERDLDHLVPICTLSPCPPNYLTEVQTAVLDEGSVDDLTETSEVEKCNTSVDTKRDEGEKEVSKGQKLPPYLRRCGDPDRKKGQNREAAQRYRSKKRSEVNSIKDRLTQLKTQREELKQRIGSKKREADMLEELISRKMKMTEANGGLKRNNVTTSSY